MIGFLRRNAIPLVVAVVCVTLTTAILAIVDPTVAAVTGVAVAGAWVLVHGLRHRPFDFSARLGTGSVLLSGLIGALGVLLVMQMIPYGRDHSNPPVTAEPAWDSPTTRELAVRACFDCHSNEVEWPWYSNFAPMSWATQRHVDEGRAVLNLSEWDRPQDEADESAETVLEGEMPPFYYTLTHPDARLDAAEKQALADGLAATLGDHDHELGENGDDHDEEQHEDDDD